MVHGMWGNTKHLDSMHRILRECRLDEDATSAAVGPNGEHFDVLIPETNQDDSTYDGIDWGGERVAEEVSDRLNTLVR